MCTQCAFVFPYMRFYHSSLPLRSFPMLPPQSIQQESFREVKSLSHTLAPSAFHSACIFQPWSCSCIVAPRFSSSIILSSPQPPHVLPLGPSIDGTALRPRLFPPLTETRGTPATTLGSLINSGSNLAGIRHITERYSPLNAPDGEGTAALRHKWSLRSSRKLVAALLKKLLAENPLLRFASMISSNKRIFGSEAGVDSRSDMNSLNPTRN